MASLELLKIAWEKDLSSRDRPMRGPVCIAFKVDSHFDQVAFLVQVLAGLTDRDWEVLCV